MRTSEILQVFHGMPACDRVDLLCRMLHYCVPYEAHFLGTVLVDSSKEHYKSFVSKAEVNANRVNYYSGFKDVGLTHDVCERLCCALAVVHADNHPVAEVVFNLLDDQRVLKQLDDVKDVQVLQDFRLLYVMGVNHPAFTFNQRQMLLYKYLQQMDSMFSEKAKFGFSLSNSMEKTLTSEGGESGRYPPESLKEPAPDAYITRCEVHSVYKRLSDKRYVYMILVEWSDGTQYTIRRTYGDFFSFQTKLLDLFPEEGGQKGKKHPRLIPYLPGKNYSRFLKNKEVAEKRLPELHRYSKELMALPDRITRFSHVLEFFKPRPTDEKEDYPPLHKITNLYDLGKTRVRVQSEPGMRGSPTHSPMLHRNVDSPLHRATPTTISQPNGHVESPSIRSARTLPPPAHVVSSDDSSPTVIPRRPTYPLSNKLKKSENSAFTPIGVSALSEDDLASTVTLTASQVSIPHVIPDPYSSSSPSSSSGANTLVSGASLAAYTSSKTSTLTGGRGGAEAAPPPADRAYSSSGRSSSDGATSNTGRHLSSVADRHGAHVQPVATLSSPLTADGGGLSSAAEGGRVVVQKVSNGVAANSPHAYANAYDSQNSNVHGYQQSELGSSEASSEAHTLTRDRADDLVEVTSPGFNMEGGSSAWINTVNQSLLAYAPPSSVIQTTPQQHHQYQLPHSAIMQVIPSGPGRTYLHSQTSPTSVVTSSIVSSNISPSPTHSETSTQSGGMPFSPGLMQYSPYSPIPGMYPHISPLASPIPQVKKQYRRQHGSNVSVNRMPTESDTLLVWLKSLRLHKYYPMFENTTFEEMCSLSVDTMKEKGLTEGAAKKLHKKLEELRSNNFGGFSGMPIAPGMTRKPSTCSLPASLLMEQQRMTPSSSCDGLSPTGSTCSLGMVGRSHAQLRRTPTPSRTQKRHSSHYVEQGRQGNKNESSATKDDSSVAVLDAAIVKAVPSVSSPPLSSPDSKVDSSLSSEVGLCSENPLKGLTDHRTCEAAPHKVNGPVPSSSGNERGELTSSWKAGGVNVSNNSNWADESVTSGEEGRLVNQPEWANLSTSSSGVPPVSGLSPVVSGSVRQHQSTPHSSGSHHHHHHHKHRPPSPSQSRTVHQIHSSNSNSDIIPIQTNPSQSSPFLSSPPSSTSSPSSSHTPSVSSSTSTTSAPGSAHSSTQQHSTNTHATPTSTSIHSTTSSSSKQRQPHTPVSKRNSSDVPNHHSPILQAPQAQQVFLGGNRNPNIVGIVPPGRGGAGGHNWIVRPVLLPNHPVPVTVIGVPTPNRAQHHQVIHTTSPAAAHNGLMRNVPLQTRLPASATMVSTTFVPSQPSHSGLVVYPPSSVNHVQGTTPPAMCFNCGKRGHLGNSCPGVTMATNDPENFHKKLEKRVSSKRSS